jgi:hypothetical protein
VSLLFEKRMLRRIFGLKRQKEHEDGEIKITKSFIIFDIYKILLRLPNQGGEMATACSTHWR